MEQNKKHTSYKRQNTRQIGDYHEVLAEEYLECNGYRILERNFRCKLGEVDIIAMHQDALVFVEVKYRASAEHGYPSDAVNYKKQIRISNVASYYVYTHKQYINRSCRFDVVSIIGGKVTLYQNAFPYCGRFSR